MIGNILNGAFHKKLLSYILFICLVYSITQNAQNANKQCKKAKCTKCMNRMAIDRCNAQKLWKINMEKMEKEKHRKTEIYSYDSETGK